MSNVDDSRVAHWEAAQQRGSRETPRGPPLNPPGGGGTYDDVEARLAKVESDMEYVKRDVAELRMDMRATKESVGDLKTAVGVLATKVDGLPTKDWIGTHFRNWILGAGAVLSLVTVLSRFIGH